MCLETIVEVPCGQLTPFFAHLSVSNASLYYGFYGGNA